MVSLGFRNAIGIMVAIGFNELLSFFLLGMLTQQSL
jgi:hypothetical protein